MTATCTTAGVITLMLWSGAVYAQPCLEGDRVVGIDASGQPVCQTGGGYYFESTYLASFGLNLIGNTFSVDTGEIQTRILGNCPKGSAIRQVFGDGSVACVQVSGPAGFVGPFQARVHGSCEPFGAIQAIGEDGNVLCWGGAHGDAMVFDSGWTAYPFGSKTLIDIPPADDVFVQGLVRGMSRTGGRLISPAMSASESGHALAYVALSNDAIGLNGSRHLLSIRNLGDRSDVLLEDGEIRLRAYVHKPAFDSGFRPCTTDQTIRIDHRLNRFPTLTVLELAEHPDGSGWRVPVMGNSLHDSSGWRQTALVQLDEQRASIRTGGRLAAFRDLNGNLQTPTKGFFRLRLYDFSPDFDSGWQATSTVAGQRDRRFRHDFGRIPGLLMVYVAQRGQDATWCLPAMGNFHRQYTHGVGLYSMDGRYIVLKGGSASLAQFIDQAGKPSTPKEGVVRVLAWR